ncbi:MAG: hypothetical protein AAB354_11940 [candidate division KSB1 bacterium]
MKMMRLSLCEMSNKLAGRPVAELSDDEVLALSKMKMTRSQSECLGELLSTRKEVELTADGQQEFFALMQLSAIGTLRKAEALAEAVQRGLRGPMRS